MQIVDWVLGSSMHIPPWEAFVRMLAAVIAGGIVGFDRELRNKPAGLRTHILTSLAAALFTLITMELHHTVTGNNEDTAADPIRIIEAVTAGVAFLAAGAIIQSRGNVRGLTTGANMWLAGALGVACGAGDYTLAAFGTTFAVIVLVLLGRLEAMAGKRAKDKDSDRS
ncbi:MAG TPA: MgtC/SapB family protein [Steroidobacteraceae bacterium]|nr:MgtC/SapB family protein [Steroidobacteraceae bacterium]